MFETGDHALHDRQFFCLRWLFCSRGATNEWKILRKIAPASRTAAGAAWKDRAEDVVVLVPFLDLSNLIAIWKLRIVLVRTGINLGVQICKLSQRAVK